jgi:ubiquitin-conjugating enzyme E2 C
MASRARILKDIKVLHSDEKKTGCYQIIDVSNPTKLQVYLLGQKDTPYDGFKFKLEISPPSNYPFTAPSISVKSYIIHPNFHKENICLDILSERWSPATNLSALLISLVSLLADPNIDSPLDSECASYMRNNSDEKYRKYVRNKLIKNNAVKI